MSYAYFTGRGRRGRDLGRAHIRKLVAEKSVTVSVQWYDGEGSYAGNEKTTLFEIQARLGNCVQAVDAGQARKTDGLKLVAVARLATGEVARIYMEAE